MMVFNYFHFKRYRNFNFHFFPWDGNFPRGYFGFYDGKQMTIRSKWSRWFSGQRRNTEATESIEMQFSMSRPEFDVFVVCYVLTKLDDEKRWKLFDLTKPVRSSDSSRSRLLQHYKYKALQFTTIKIMPWNEKKKKKIREISRRYLFAWRKIVIEFSNSNFLLFFRLERIWYFFVMVCPFFLSFSFFRRS